MRQMKQFVQDIYLSVEGGLFTAAGTVPCKDIRSWWATSRILLGTKDSRSTYSLMSQGIPDADLLT